MRGLLRLAVALAAGAIVLMAFRALALTVYTVDGEGLQPLFLQGDRILVNRWSYGLRAGYDDGGGLFGYGRLCHSQVRRGDVVAFDNPSDSLLGVFVCQCVAIPGDTISYKGRSLVLPGVYSCADEDYYWMKSLNGANPFDSSLFGPLPESRIIGRVCIVLYNHDDRQWFFQGFNGKRFLRLVGSMEGRE